MGVVLVDRWGKWRLRGGYGEGSFGGRDGIVQSIAVCGDCGCDGFGVAA